jgi:hypothetical protein
VTDLRAALSHVLWIGGGPQAGKTTLSRLLAGKWDLKIYNLDWHQVREHAERPGARALAFTALSMDERWATPSVGELVDRSIAIWEDLFLLVVEDLLSMTRSRTIVAEGPGAFPWCVAPLLASPRQAVFFVPTRAQRETAAARRWGPGQVERFPGIVDRDGALAKLRERDALLDERIFASCRELGLRRERMDGSRDLDANLAMVEEQFQPYLPSTPNV